ncbi:MAG: type II toxin-antitoxin system PemK/MazF family toxin [Rhodocyclaceae bacterium]|nr:type II toxin-antitoxin system PemK/MazF family toxin [Rhodocyclaceae bacterium]
MKQAGQIVLTPFPYTDLSGAKLRPVLMLRQASRFDDWLVCMVSSRIEQAEAGFDEVLLPADADFVPSGLKAASVLRLSRLAVLEGSLLAGSIGAIDDARLSRVRLRLARWIGAAD